MQNREEPLTYEKLVIFFHKTIKPQFNQIESNLKKLGKQLDHSTKRMERFSAKVAKIHRGQAAFNREIAARIDKLYGSSSSLPSKN